ncbi:amidohydrolase [Veillonella sp. CHU732]|uniref:amidohydrolase n=1 Tax=Veillonella sp. CHU732 TaxID=2490949 RepID=UPI000F8DE77D|nr:amidohydrolase [Veillonella sp. CHU732]
MLTKEEVKQRVCNAIVAGQERLRVLASAIMDEPELGYKEHKTSQKVQDMFTELGIPFTTGHAITGVKGRLQGGKSKKTVAMIGELDAIVCHRHPKADPMTGAAHCCGHNVQIANLFAVAMGLQAEGVMEALGGDVVLFAVPAEEMIEVDYRNTLREKGTIKYLGGKQQLIYEGAFDDIHMAMQMHVETADTPTGEMNLGSTSNGFVAKLIEYHGKIAHAAASPHEGINALNAALMGVMGVHAIRETFKESDYFRFHPIINQGGTLVNCVPDYVQVESYVRASNVQAIVDGNQRVNRALKAGGDAVGATCVIHDLPGYLPMRDNPDMNNLLRSNSEPLFGIDNVRQRVHMTASTDMGDVSHLMPVIHPWVGCIEGVLHSAEYNITVPDVAYIKTAQALAMTIVDLLYDEAQVAEEILENFEAPLTKETYIELLDSIASGK